jgi:general secretion pathway protein F
MGRYRYQVVEADGRIATGFVDAIDAAAATAALQDKGSWPLSIEAAATDAGARRGRTQGPEVLARVAGELAVMLDAGIEVDRALAALAGMDGLRSVAPALREIVAEVRGGTPLSEAAARQPELFPAHSVGMIRAGEIAAALAPALGQLAQLAENQARARATLRSALIYPAVLVVTAALSITVLFVVVLPQLETLFETGSDRLPFVTRALMAASHAFRDHGPLALALLLGALALARHALSRPGPRRAFDRWLLGAPAIGGFVRKVEAGRCARMLATLLGNGIPAPRALELSAAVSGNTAFAEGVASIGTALTEGRGLVAPLRESGLFPALASDLVQIGEDTGRLGPMLSKAADILEAEVDRATKRTIALMVPLLTVGLGGVVALVIASVVMAVLSINSIAT